MGGLYKYLYLTPGSKSFISVNTIDELIRAIAVTTGNANRTPRELYACVPWLFRAVEIRAQAVASMPFIITDGTTTIDDSTRWQNKIGFMRNPTRLLYLIESSLILTGASYLFRERNRLRITDLRYMTPSSIAPRIDTDKGLVGFNRHVGSRVVQLATDEIVYFWYPDPYVEVGPPTTCPAAAALNAANVLYNLDQFVAGYFERGAIKATILAVEGTTTPQAREQLRHWWERVVQGIKNAWSTHIINASVKPIQIGDGVDELENNNLSESRREDIATALGIPHSILFSNAANYAVSQEDNLHFYTKTVIPEFEFIAATLNEQVFAPMGLQMRGRPEILDVMQEDENNRAQSLSALVSAIASAPSAQKLRAAMLLLGYDMTEEVENLLFGDVDGIKYVGTRSSNVWPLLSAGELSDGNNEEARGSDTPRRFRDIWEKYRGG